MEEVMNMLSKLQSDMSSMRGENAELRRVVDTLFAGGHTVNESSGNGQSRNERAEKVSHGGTQVEHSVTNTEKSERVNPPSEAVTGSSLRTGMLVYQPPQKLCLGRNFCSCC
jgi:hypothetical protein